MVVVALYGTPLTAGNGPWMDSLMQFVQVDESGRPEAIDGEPWQEVEKLWRHSPLAYAPDIHTPLLILHGKDDPRVNPGQSRELYRHLKLRGKAPVRLVLYPGEGHGNRKCASKLDYNLRMMQWMEHYLKGPGGAMPPYDLEYREP